MVVICSITILKSGNSRLKGSKICSIKTASLSNISICGSVTSPCINNGIDASDIAARTEYTFLISATPFCELVVAPAGYNLTALIIPC